MPKDKSSMQKLFKTVAKNGKTYQVNKVGETLCPNCLGVDNCVCTMNQTMPTQIQKQIEEATQKIIKAVNKRLEVFELNAIDRYTESCIRSEILTIATKSAEVERDKAIALFTVFMRKNFKVTEMESPVAEQVDWFIKSLRRNNNETMKEPKESDTDTDVGTK